MAKFTTDGKDLFIDGKKVLKGWESFTGWYWFATEKVCEQESDLGDGKGTPDTIWFGFVQGLEEEWGNFSRLRLKVLEPRLGESKTLTSPMQAGDNEIKHQRINQGKENSKLRLHHRDYNQEGY